MSRTLRLSIRPARPPPPTPATAPQPRTGASLPTADPTASPTDTATGRDPREGRHLHFRTSWEGGGVRGHKKCTESTLLLLLVSKVERFFFLLCIDKKGVVVGRRRMKADIFPAGEVTLFFPSSLSPDQICLFILSKKVQGSGGLEERGAVAVRYGCGTKGCFKESPLLLHPLRSRHRSYRPITTNPSSSPFGGGAWE